MKAILQWVPLGRGGFVEHLETAQVTVRPEGIQLTFNRGQDERTRRPIRYRVFLTPAVNTGSWATDEDAGHIEHLRASSGPATALPRLEGIWVQAGERRQFRIQVEETPA